MYAGSKAGVRKVAGAALGVALLAGQPLGLVHSALAQSGQGKVGTDLVKRVLLLSIDGMHAVDYLNCSRGVTGVNGGQPYCPTMASLGQTAANYVAAETSRPSDSFPGLMTLVTGATPKTMGVWYDVGYDRALDAPETTTGNGVAGGSCTPYGLPTGSTAEYEEGIDYDQSKLNGGAPGAALTDGGIASIDPKKLPRDPAAGCAPVYPWDFVRTNTVYNLIHAAGGYTAWVDKHPSYSSIGGRGGVSVDDYYAPEINSAVVGLPGVTLPDGSSCAAVKDAGADLSSWTTSFENVKCYDQLKVNAIVNQIDGKNHLGTAAAPVPALFGMNFQTVSVGQKLIEASAGTGGYVDAQGTPSAALLKEIEDTDAAIGQMVGALKAQGLFQSTVIIITAKHGQSPVDPTLYKRNGTVTPATLVAADLPESESPTGTGIGPTEDDISLLWLKPGADAAADVAVLQQNAAAIGLGEIFYGRSLALNYDKPGLGQGLDSRTPDIIVTPNVGVTYSNSKKKQAEHGGFSHDDTNAMLLVSYPRLLKRTVSVATSTAQVAPTILTALGLDVNALDGVREEGTAILPGLIVK